MSVIEDDAKDQLINRTEHAETLTALSGDENFIKKTIFSSYDQAYAFAALWTIARDNDSFLLKNFLKDQADANISVQGQGREDIVEVSKYKSGSGIGWTEKFIDKMGGSNK